MIAKADFVKRFHKLMKDAFCRKTIQFVRKPKKFDLIDETGT